MTNNGPRRWAPVWPALALIALARLRPTGEESTRWTWAGEFASADAVLNLLLFLPLGLSLGARCIPPRRAAALGFLLSLTIEILQFCGVAGRFASPVDLLANTASSWQGAALALGWAASPIH